MKNANYLESYSYIYDNNVSVINKNNNTNHIEYTFVNPNKDALLTYIDYNDTLPQEESRIIINDKEKKLSILKNSYTYESDNTFFNLRLEKNRPIFFSISIILEDFRLSVNYDQNILSIQITEYSDTNFPKNYTKGHIIYFEEDFTKIVDEKIIEFINNHAKCITNKKYTTLTNFIEIINEILESIKEQFNNCPKKSDKELLNKIIEKFKINFNLEPNIVKKLKANPKQ